MSLPDTVFIFVLALIIFGPKKLPEIGRQIGKLVGEFRRASNEFKFQIEEELRQADIMDKRGSQPEISKPVRAEAAMEKDPATSPPLAPEPADPAEILPVGQYPNIATLDTSELEPAETPVPAEAAPAEAVESAPPPIQINAAPGSQPRTHPPFTASQPADDPAPQPMTNSPLEPVVPANRPPAQAEAEVTHG